MVRPFLSSVAWSEAASAPSGETEDQDELDGHEALPTVDRSGAQHGFIADGRGSTGLELLGHTTWRKRFCLRTQPCASSSRPNSRSLRACGWAVNKSYLYAP